jgi:hypothetical protein
MNRSMSALLNITLDGPGNESTGSARNTTETRRSAFASLPAPAMITAGAMALPMLLIALAVSRAPRIALSMISAASPGFPRRKTIWPLITPATEASPRRLAASISVRASS